LQCLDDLQFKLVFLNNLAFLYCLDHLNFLCIFHKQAGSGSESGSEIKVKVGSGSGKNNFGSTTLVCITINIHPSIYKQASVGSVPKILK
jgi:hypothetical protein